MVGSGPLNSENVAGLLERGSLRVGEEPVAGGAKA